MHGFLLAVYKMPRPLVDAEPVHLHYRLIPGQADREEPPPQRGKTKQSKGRNLLNRLRIREKGVCRVTRFVFIHPCRVGMMGVGNYIFLRISDVK